MFSRFDFRSVPTPRTRVRVGKAVALAALLISPSYRVAFSQTPAAIDQRVWFWSDDCRGGRRLGIEVLIDKKSVYHSEIRVCQMNRGDPKSENQKKVFYVPGGRTFQSTYRTATNEKIEGNIWQAGADPDDILLGVSFATKNQVLLNTIHIAKPSKTTQSEIDAGIVVRTIPIVAPN